MAKCGVSRQDNQLLSLEAWKNRAAAIVPTAVAGQRLLGPGAMLSAVSEIYKLGVASTRSGWPDAFHAYGRRVSAIPWRVESGLGERVNSAAVALAASGLNHAEVVNVLAGFCYDIVHQLDAEVVSVARELLDVTFSKAAEGAFSALGVSSGVVQLLTAVQGSVSAADQQKRAVEAERGGGSASGLFDRAVQFAQDHDVVGTVGAAAAGYITGGAKGAAGAVAAHALLPSEGSAEKK